MLIMMIYLNLLNMDLKKEHVTVQDSLITLKMKK